MPQAAPSPASFETSRPVISSPPARPTSWGATPRPTPAGSPRGAHNVGQRAPTDRLSDDGSRSASPGRHPDVPLPNDRHRLVPDRLELGVRARAAGVAPLLRPA